MLPPSGERRKQASRTMEIKENVQMNSDFTHIKICLSPKKDIFLKNIIKCNCLFYTWVVSSVFLRACMSSVTQASVEMARVETIESVGETGIGRNGLFSQHNTCFMELTRPLQTWPGLLSTATITMNSGTGTSPLHLNHNDHSLQPLQAVCVSYPSSSLAPEGQDQPPSPQHLPNLSSAPHPLPDQSQGEESGEDFPRAHSGKIMIFSYNNKHNAMLHVFLSDK